MIVDDFGAQTAPQQVFGCLRLIYRCFDRTVLQLNHRLQTERLKHVMVDVYETL